MKFIDKRVLFSKCSKNADTRQTRLATIVGMNKDPLLIAGFVMPSYFIAKFYEGICTHDVCKGELAALSQLEEEQLAQVDFLLALWWWYARDRYVEPDTLNSPAVRQCLEHVWNVDSQAIDYTVSELDKNKETGPAYVAQLISNLTHQKATVIGLLPPMRESQLYVMNNSNQLIQEWVRS